MMCLYSQIMFSNEVEAVFRKDVALLNDLKDIDIQLALSEKDMSDLYASLDNAAALQTLLLHIKNHGDAYIHGSERIVSLAAPEETRQRSLELHAILQHARKAQRAVVGKLEQGAYRDEKALRLDIRYSGVIANSARERIAELDRLLAQAVLDQGEASDAVGGTMLWASLGLLAASLLCTLGFGRSLKRCLDEERKAGARPEPAALLSPAEKMWWAAAFAQPYETPRPKGKNPD